MTHTTAVRSAELFCGVALHPFVCGCGRFHSSRSWEEDGWDTAANTQKLKLNCGCGVTSRKTDGGRVSSDGSTATTN